MNYFQTEEFTDLAQCSADKLTKLRDRAEQNYRESLRRAKEDKDRLDAINKELDERKRSR